MNRFQAMTLVAALLAGLLPASQADAVPVTWYLVDWAFEDGPQGGDGRTAEGWFVYETSNNTITSWNITVSPASYNLFGTPGAPLQNSPEFTYSNLISGHSRSIISGGDLFLFSTGADRFLRFDPAVILPVEGGNVLQGGNDSWRLEWFPGGATQVYTTTGYFSTTDPNAASSAVPEPSIALLGTVGILSLAARRRRTA